MESEEKAAPGKVTPEIVREFMKKHGLRIEPIVKDGVVIDAVLLDGKITPSGAKYANSTIGEG